ncbi:MAG: exonuclease domain-containing protein [Planctomycetota bacterium]
MQFTSIDFETANSSRGSACSIGLSFVCDGVIVDSRHYYIRPDPLYFDPFNTSIHGISESDVINAPTFEERWSELKKFFVSPVIAHNASFDMSVLRHALDDSGLSYPTIDYFCTRVISKQVWKQFPSFALDYIAREIGISFKHHNAEEDARACSLVAIHACKEVGAKSLYDLQSICGIRVGSLYNGGYSTCGGPSISSRKKTESILCASDIRPTSDQIDPNHPFYDMSFAFTGAMSAMSRREAFQTVVNHGGICHDNVRADTNFLVVGQDGYKGYITGFKSSKLKKAENMLANGAVIEIISEADFVRLI